MNGNKVEKYHSITYPVDGSEVGKFAKETEARLMYAALCEKYAAERFDLNIVTVTTTTTTEKVSE